jgi:fructan beta-fructosidase
MCSPSSTNKRARSIGSLALLAFSLATLGSVTAAPPPATASLYAEALRPQFHFTSATNWLNDPNGLVYYKGEYHLFFQHNPSGIDWGNMTWAHAVSPDLLHWRQMDDALKPDRLGTMFSGSAAVDWNNTAGFQTGDEKTLVALYTAAGGTSPESKGQPFTQCLAYSTDRGRTWTKYAGNPVLPHVAKENRDPKLIWHEPTRRWIVALYKDGETFGLFASPDLKTWTHLQDVTMPGCSECPDFFEIKVERPSAPRMQTSGPSELLPSEPRAHSSRRSAQAKPEASGPGEHGATDAPFAPPPLKRWGNQASADTRWILTAANGRYLVGAFDGQLFTPESGPHVADWGANYYAVQTWSDTPDGRRIQIAWMQGGKYPGMPFNQQMSIPCEMRLRALPEGLRLCRLPVKEVETLRRTRHTWKDATLRTGENLLSGVHGDLFDIVATIEPGDAREIGFKIRGEHVRYLPADGKLTCLGKTAEIKRDAPTAPIKLRLLVDRTSIEVFANDGHVVMTSCFLPKPEDRTLALYAEGGTARASSLEVYELGSAWKGAGSLVSE